MGQTCCAGGVPEGEQRVTIDVATVGFTGEEGQPGAGEADDRDRVRTMSEGTSVSATSRNTLSKALTFNIVNRQKDISEDDGEDNRSTGSGSSQSKEALLSKFETLVDTHYDILKAEEVLTSLRNLLQDSPEEWEAVTSSGVFQRFKRKICYFHEVGKSVCADQDSWINVFEADGGKQTIKVFMSKDNPNQAEYRVSALIPAKLTNVLAVANEIQMLSTWNTLVTGTPKTIGRRTAHYMLVNYQMSLLGGMYKLDVLSEVRRFSNIEGGILAEYIESASEEHPSYIPPPSGFKRPKTQIKNVWLAVGDGHTLLIQYGSLTLPFSVAKWLVQSLGMLAGKFVLGGIVKNSMQASEPGNAWEQPKSKDVLGLYARLDQCAASKDSEDRGVAAKNQSQAEFDTKPFFEQRLRSLVALDPGLSVNP